MKKILVAVDNTNNAKSILSVFDNLVRPPEGIVLLHVKQLEGNSMMIDMLSDSEIETLKESMEGTDQMEKLDMMAEKVISFYTKELEKIGLFGIKSIVKAGRPTEEILRVAEEEKVDLIVVGCSGKTRAHKFISGCASKEVEKNSKVPVLVAKGNGCGEHTGVWREEAYAAQ